MNVSVSSPYEISVDSVLENIKCTKSADNLFHSFKVLWEKCNHFLHPTSVNSLA